MKMVKKLEKEFIGRGEVKGFVFKQIKETDKCYLYQVDDTYYEVFIKRYRPFNSDVNIEVYPKSNAFGKNSWTFYDINNALKMLESLNQTNI